MASSLKVSDLQSLTSVTGEDLFLVADTETSSSKKLSFADLLANINNDILSVDGGVNALNAAFSTETSLREAAIAALQQKINDLEQLNLNAGLSTGYLHVATFTGG